jgi:NTE family protein
MSIIRNLIPHIFRKKKKNFYDICLCKKDHELNFDKCVCKKTTISYKELIDKTKKNLDYENVVIEGGGIKGLAYLGALEEIEKLNIKFKRIAGSSMGAIAGCLLALGYSSSEIKDEMLKINFRGMIDDKMGILRDIYNLFSKYGVCSGDKFMNLMGKLIKKKTGDENYTFKQLYDDKGIMLVITGSNIDNYDTIYYSHLTHPDVPIKLAVRISIGVPLIYRPIRCMKCNKGYLIDGGVTDNYPLHIFDDEKINTKTLGIKLLTDNEIETEDGINYKVQIKDFKGYCASMIGMLCSVGERCYITDGYWERTIIVRVPNLPITKFKLKDKQINDLIERGRESVKKYFDNNN